MHEILIPQLVTAALAIGIILYSVRRHKLEMNAMTDRLILASRERTAKYLAESEARVAAMKAEAEAATRNPELAHTPEPAEYRNDTDPVGSAVAALDPDTRRAVKLRYFDGMSAGEVARALGWPESRVAEALADARRELRDHLTPA